MIEFVEECRKEWKRLGVPDPIANEMALDLTSDIDEAVADGGSAEDVLGNSLFDPRRFAAAWASARGVTGPTILVDPLTPAAIDRHPWNRPLMIATVSLFGFLFALAAAALVIGRHGVAVAATIGRRVALPRPPRFFGTPVHLISGPSFPAGPLVALALVFLLAGFAVVSLAILYRTLGPNRNSRRRFW